MKVIDKIKLADLKNMAEKMYGDLVKADVDIKRQMLIVDMEMHVDGEQALLEQGSQQSDIWGVNLYPDKFGSDDFVEFDSMINIRPAQGNPSRDVLDESVRAKIKEIIDGAVHD